MGFLGCSKKAGPPPPPIASSNDAVSVFTLVGHSDNGRKKWEVQGETADLLGEIVQLSPVTARSFGDVEVKLTANRGRYQKTTQDIYLQKNVVVTTSDGGRLTTESLQWWHERDMARTLDWLNISRPGMTVLGIGGVGFPKLKRARVERKITVTLQGEEGQTVVTCDGPMEVDYVQHKARFWRNVLVRDAQGFIRSDRLDVLLTSETNQIQEARFWGHVQIHRGNQRATAQRANYWGSPKRTRLTGHTRMVMLPQDNEQ
ncbi:MAG: LPS export ABC transporter periplasmic protein LptC [Candidatus Omnitrophica bacterium]|nr:LPS export ABC transporter periplasmic protein LptC [Candidatus Omnitrophota bacterium]